MRCIRDYSRTEEGSDNDKQHNNTNEGFNYNMNAIQQAITKKERKKDNPVLDLLINEEKINLSNMTLFK